MPSIATLTFLSFDVLMMHKNLVHTNNSVVEQSQKLERLIEYTTGAFGLKTKQKVITGSESSLLGITKYHIFTAKICKKPKR